MENSPPVLVMLEDELERLERFNHVIDGFELPVDFRHWRTADGFISGYRELKFAPSLICLDHDLFTERPDDPDPGDGKQVAKFLSQCDPVCHAIIHSSNQPAADAMYFLMLESGWDVERIAPLGSDWIESYWWPEARGWLKNRSC